MESEEGKGSEFIFTIKLEAGVQSEKQEIQPLASEKMKDKSVLIVDGQEKSRRILRKFCLETGMLVYEAVSGAKALEWLSACEKKQALPDVVVMDIVMPGMDGCEAIRKIRNNPAYRGIKVVAITSLAGRGSSAEMQEAGFDGFLPNPIQKNDLVGVIKTVLGDKRKRGQIVTRHMADEISCKGIKVLVADDNPINRKLILLLLRRLGCVPEAVNNGQEAVDRVKENDYDLILMDLMMPVMGGVDATNVIYNDLGKKLPIIALTAAAMKEDRENCFAAGMKDFLTKPIVFEKLKEKLLKWCRAGSDENRG